jgi:osmotically-inducible protein OsmY
LISKQSMNKRSRIAAIAAAALMLVAVSMLVAHRTTGPTQKPLKVGVAEAPNVPDDAITAAIKQTGARVEHLVARNVGGIVVLRGDGPAPDAGRAADAVKSLGFTRVANLIRTTTYDDESLRREAERKLAIARSLDGCVLRVSCANGVISLAGTVHSDLQEDVARSILRHVSGAQDVHVELGRI